MFLIYDNHKRNSIEYGLSARFYGLYACDLRLSVTNRNDSLFYYETIAYFYKKIVLKVKLLFLCDKLVSGPECLTLSESVPLAKLQVYIRVTLRPCTRPPGCTIDITEKIQFALRSFIKG